MNAILIFTLATVVNVSLSTIRAICTIKRGKTVSALTNAICYGFYPLVIMLTAQGTVDIIANMAITAVANFVCVYLIKLAEEKARKDKLWRIDLAIPAEETALEYFQRRHIGRYLSVGIRFLTESAHPKINRQSSKPNRHSAHRYIQ